MNAPKFRVSLTQTLRLVLWASIATSLYVAYKVTEEE